MTQSFAETSATTGQQPLVHAGGAGELFPIVVKNVLLSLITLGVYRFWAKTAVRRYLWNRTALMSAPLEYTGTGAELFLGFLIVILVVFVPYGIINGLVTVFLEADAPEIYNAYTGIIVLAAVALTGVALYRARRYRLSRTNWRGIRSSLSGSAVQYGLRYVGCQFLNLITLGWTYPWSRMLLVGRITDNMWFGDQRFRFNGVSRPLYRRFAVVWFAAAATYPIVLAIALTFIFFYAPDAFDSYVIEGEADTVAEIDPLLIAGFSVPLAAALIVGVVGVIWYKVLEFRHVALSTGVSDLSFRFGCTFGSLLRLLIGNLAILVFTLGLGGAFAQMRKVRFLCRHLAVEGTMDLEAVLQTVGPAPSRGEGLADAFDVGDV